jgi:RNA polymerase sigma-70 factor (ECF subfamily)
MGPSPEERQGAELLRHAAWIRRLALGLVGDAALAEDLVQDTWLAALRRRPSADQPLRPWLGTVLRNAARQAFRGGARRGERQALARAPAPVAGPEELAERLEVERRLTDELARLDEPFRSTLMLRYYEQLEPGEIARRQGLPAGTVRWRVKRGLERLRERLDDCLGERAQWSALVLSLARPDAGLPWAGTATAALPGALAMHALTKVGIGAAAVVALAVGLRLGGALPESVWPLRREAPAALAMRPLTPELAEAETLAAEPVLTPGSERRAVRPAPAPAAASQPRPRPAPRATASCAWSSPPPAAGRPSGSRSARGASPRAASRPCCAPARRPTSARSSWARAARSPASYATGTASGWQRSR